MLKIALINNINNNFFAFARYLRDKGIDAHVFQVDALDEHFNPTCDTFDSEEITNHFTSIANLTFRDFYKLPFSPITRWRLKKFKNKLNNFDIVIACGGLAILEWAGIKIDIFMPHGGDLYQSPFMFDYCIKKHFPYSVLMKRYIKYQRRAISKTRVISALASMDMHFQDALTKLNRNCIDWAMPMIYPVKNIVSNKWDFLDKHDFILFSHSRQGWKTALDYKGNDRAIRAFSRFIKSQNKFKNPVLILFNYGVDVDASKELINDLNISQYVIWMPKMERKFIYEGLKKASLVFDFFHEDLLTHGGVSFEAFSCCTPVMGNTKLKIKNFNTSLPLIHAFSEQEIFNVLMDYASNPNEYKENGKKSKQWFDENVGTHRVDNHIELMKFIAKNKNIKMENKEFNIFGNFHLKFCKEDF